MIEDGGRLAGRIMQRSLGITLDMEGSENMLPRALRTSLLVVAFGMLAAAAVAWLFRDRGPALTVYFLRADILWLVVMAIALLALRSLSATPLFSAWASVMQRRPRMAAAGMAITVAAIGLVGTYVVFQEFALSRDEHMAEFDSAILRAGRLIAMLPAEWRPFAGAMEPDFRLPVPGDVAWVSSYLPGNAALRALFDSIGIASLTSPVLAGLAVIALVGIARRLWPDRPDAALVSGILLATSPQFLLMAMTPYAMTGHLALNLVWLWLFLRDRPSSHVGAAAVGFLACGLHQLVFHPLFVAPFLLQLLLERRWRLGFFYVIAYALIGLFWVLYWRLVLDAHGIAAPAGSSADVGAGFLAVRIAELLGNFGAENLDVMAKNLVRFVAWQNALLLPLAALGVAAAWRTGGALRSLLIGMVLTAGAILVLLPYQGHGWGYRYFHGLLGGASLVAAQGWIVMAGLAEQPQRRAAWSALGLSAAFSLLVMLPLRGYEAHRFIAPYASAMAAIERKQADIVIVDDAGISFGIDLVRNDPLLRNVPKVLLMQALRPAQLRDLCARYRVAIFDKQDALAQRVPTFEISRSTTEAGLKLLFDQACRTRSKRPT
jgi:hypothetical protein